MQDVLASELDSPAQLLALVKMNAATSKKMIKMSHINLRKCGLGHNDQPFKFTNEKSTG